MPASLMIGVLLALVSHPYGSSASWHCLIPSFCSRCAEDLSGCPWSCKTPMYTPLVHFCTPPTTPPVAATLPLVHKQDKSPEELRHQDYSVGIRAGWQTAFVHPMARSSIIADAFWASPGMTATSAAAAAPRVPAGAAAAAAGAGLGLSGTPQTSAGFRFGSPLVGQVGADF
jgi:hypothetical protein